MNYLMCVVYCGCYIYIHIYTFMFSLWPCVIHSITDVKKLMWEEVIVSTKGDFNVKLGDDIYWRHWSMRLSLSKGPN
jgi:hypothetical protein